MQATNTPWAVGNAVSAAKLNVFHTDIDTLFAELSNENITTTYNASGQLTQIVDNDNSITINISWVDFTNATSKLYIQKVGDPKKWTVSYNVNGYISGILYA